MKGMAVNNWLHAAVSIIVGGFAGNAVVRGDWITLAVAVTVWLAWMCWVCSYTAWIWRRDRARRKEELVRDASP